MSRAPFRGRIPDDRHYDLEHDMWVKPEGDGLIVRIGATAYGLHIAGEIIGFTAKPKGAHIDRNRGLGTVESAKTVLAIHAPIAFRLTEANETAEECPALLNRDPYDAGWMVRGQPLEWGRDVDRLVDAAAYRQHILRAEPDAEFN